MKRNRAFDHPVQERHFSQGASMRRVVPSIRPFLLILFLVAALAQSAAAQVKPRPPGKSVPAITFEDSAVDVSGMTPGQAVIWFGVEHAIDAGFSGDIYQHYNSGVAAADGTARLDVGRTLVPGSIWVAVDLSSGLYVTAAPGTSSPQIFPDPTLAATLVAGGGTLTDQIVDHRPFIMGLSVRPGVGAWIFGGGDGGDSDLDGANDGSLSLALDQFSAFPGSPPAPAQIGINDLWFIVDPQKVLLSVQLNGVAQP
jgi:hypothetical protein